MKPEALKKLMAITLAEGMGAVTFKRLYESSGSLDAVLAGLNDPGLLKKADVEIKKAEDAGVDMIGIFDERYPAELKAIYDPPILLYVKGSLPAGGQKIAVVGSRLASTYGRETAKRFSRQMAAAGVTIVSGLAEGIDAAAHEGALEADGVTLAVFGCGLSTIYPRQHKKLAEAILKRGALISEYPMGMAPLAAYFPMRNRIISGLSNAVLVVEAKAKSGALITADCALEEGREVFAVPGNIDSSRSLGTNALLKQGAKMVTSVADILSDLGLEAKTQNGENRLKNLALGKEENKILDLLDAEALQMDGIISETGFTVSETASFLALLELKGLVKELPGKRFSKI
ncbi:MAG: DNA-protecting protein DprA [Candidatus Omnitrophica bacterium]|nr:DNA-protecting protein DprA [Candidatus Omnitrophota bacterium]